MSYVGKVTTDGSSYKVGSTLYGVCDTASEVQDKVAVIDGFDTLEAGVTVHIKFINSNATISPTLAIKPTIDGTATTAKSIYMRNTDDPSYFEVVKWPSGSVISLTYDGSCWMINDCCFDTVNTAGSTDTQSKIYLIGADSQTDYSTTYSHDTAYVGTDGCVYSGGVKTATAQDLSAKVNKSGDNLSGTLIGKGTGINFEVWNDAETHKLRFTATDTPRSGIYDIVSTQWAFWKNQDGEYKIGPNGYAVQARTQPKGTTKYALREGVVFAYRAGADSNNATVAYVSQWDGDGVIYQHHVSSINVAVDIWHESIKVTNNHNANIQVILVGQFNDNSSNV